MIPRYFTKAGGWAGDIAYVRFDSADLDSPAVYVRRNGRDQDPAAVVHPRLRLRDAMALAGDLHELTEITLDQAADLIWDHLTQAKESLT